VIRQQFLDGAAVVVAALGDPAVAAAWDRPSVLEAQSVGSLAGHLARGGVFVVGDYLDQPAPPAATFESAADYFARIAEAVTAEASKAVRDRGAAVAAAGPAAVAAKTTDRLAALRTRLPAEPADRVTVVAGGAMALDDYLVTRVVEQVVHLDDLARSIGAPPWPVPDELVLLTLVTATSIGLRRWGPSAMLQALYRSTPSVLPVL
jgi:Mycothiol maleylpyruvate isomerase N-terminal domain